jgi:PAS domain S-box-containing protein
MEFQTNPYIIWQIIPVLINILLVSYIQNRPRKKPESNVLSGLLIAGAFWSLMNVFQLASPDLAWQSFWHTASFVPVVIIPTAWFLLAVKFTGYFQVQVERIRGLFLVIPSLTMVILLTNGYHEQFFSSYKIIPVNEFAILIADKGPVFYLHTTYSYLLIFSGVLFLGISLFTNFKKHGIQTYGLILGAVTPVVSNIYYLFGSPPAGFPNPTPISFTITGIAFAWSIFAGHLLDVVPIAHEAIVARLISGVIILDLENKILDINPAAAEILDLPSLHPIDSSLLDVLTNTPGIFQIIQPCLDAPPGIEQEVNIAAPGSKKPFNLRITGIQDKRGRFSGRMLQFTDISREKRVEDNLATAKESLTSILDTLTDFYFETDINGMITNINQAFCEKLGFSTKDQIIGKHLRHFTDRESVRQVFQNFRKVFEEKEIIELFRYSYHTRDGREYIGETTVSPIIEGELVIGARGVLRDITDRARADEILQQTKENAEARAKELAVINRVATLSNQSLNLNNVLQALCVELTTIFPIRNAGIGLITANKESLEVVAFHSAEPDEPTALGMVLPLAGNIASLEVIEKKRTIVIQNSQDDPRMKAMVGVAKERGTKAIMIVPLLSRGNAIGTIGMPAKDPDHIFEEKDIKLAEIIASQIAAAIDNAQLFAKTETALDVAERDLEIGRVIQSGFFPEAIPDLPGWETAVHYESARQVSGDFYDFFQFENSKLTALIIADVCDKGVGAALFMILFRSLFRAFSRIVIDDGKIKEHLKNIIVNTNDYVSRIHGNANMFATVFFGILDPDKGILYYVNGGHEPPAMLNPEGKIFHRLKPTGPAIGLFPEASYEVEQIEFKPGDFMVGFTDGTMDAQNTSGYSYSEERLLKYMEAPWTSLFSMVYELKTELRNYEGDESQFDDITLLSIRRKSMPGNERHSICRVAEMSKLGELLEFAKAAAEECKLNQGEVISFRQAADERCKNIILNGYKGREPGFISLSFECDPQKARLIIRDDGQFLWQDQEASETGSVGIHPVDRVMDSVSYSRMKENGNQLILEKQRGTKSQSNTAPEHPEARLVETRG